MEAAAESLTCADSSEALVEFLYLTPVGIIRFRPDGRVTMANPAAAQLLMPLAADADMSDLYRLFGRLLPDLRRASPASRHRRARSAISCNWQCRTPTPCSARDPQGRSRHADGGGPGHFPGDRAGSRIRDDQQRFRAIFENVRDYAIFTLDIDGYVDEWNRSLNRLGGWEPADVVGMPLATFFPPSEPDQSPGDFLLDRARRLGTAEFEGWCVRRDGSVFWGNTVATALPDPDGHASGYVLVTRDLTERKQMEDRLLALATTDPLTGARNRRAGECKLKDAFRHWRRYGRGFAVLMLDCDHFKAVNDRWGHDAGDAVLRGLVRICITSLRDTDVVMRWGGEEFLLLLAETDCDTAVVVAERLRLSIGTAPVVHDGQVINVTVSIGVAVIEEADAGPDGAIRRADRAVYRAKRGGRNRVVAHREVEAAAETECPHTECPHTDCGG